MPEAVTTELQRRGHPVKRVDAFTDTMGHAGAILIDPSTGVIYGWTDPRGDGLAAGLKAFAERPLLEPLAHLILDARYEKVREAGVVMSQAVLVDVGIDWDGRRQILAVEMAARESRSA